MTAYIAAGSNVGDSRATLASAADALDARSDCRVTARSSVYLTQPVGPEQPPYLNQVLAVETELAPRALLEALLAIELAHGRDRSTAERWGPRTLDLDLLIHGDQTLDEDGLTVPHPRIAERPFVLVPLLELAPERDRGELAALAGSDDWTWVRPLTDDPALPRTRLVEADTADALRAFSADCRAWSRQGLTVGFVPTMGYLHRGHESLIRIARARCDRVVVSIFVNPIQFGPTEDLATYPRDLDADLARCRAAGVDVVMTTTPEAMYPPAYSTYVTEEALGDTLCGASRDGHFRGVTTVVAKLFNLVGPTEAFFGQKDAQQATIIRRMVEDLAMPVDVRVLPIVREADGLALSSRNAYLSDDERQRALGLQRGLRAAAAAFDGGERDAAALLDAVRARIDPADRVDYASLVDPVRLRPIERPARSGDLLALAVFVGRTRLIDNRVL